MLNCRAKVATILLRFFYKTALSWPQNFLTIKNKDLVYKNALKDHRTILFEGAFSRYSGKDAVFCVSLSLHE